MYRTQMVLQKETESPQSGPFPIYAPGARNSAEASQIKGPDPRIAEPRRPAVFRAAKAHSSLWAPNMEPNQGQIGPSTKAILW